MTQYATLGSQRIVSGNVVFPYYGIWTSDLALAESMDLSSQEQMVIGNISATCHIFRSAGFAGSKSARVVGGYGGWRNEIPAQAYYNPNGVNKSTIVGDAAALCGEQVSLAGDGKLGSTYVRERAPGSRTLRTLFGEVWYIGLDGITNIKTRTESSLITSDFTVVSWSGGKGIFEIATEDMLSWMPARTFTSPTVLGLQTISMTSISFGNDGKTRLQVMSTGDVNA